MPYTPSIFVLCGGYFVLKNLFKVQWYYFSPVQLYIFVMAIYWFLRIANYRYLCDMTSKLCKFLVNTGE